jgi:hypothetical protein
VGSFRIAQPEQPNLNTPKPRKIGIKFCTAPASARAASHPIVPAVHRAGAFAPGDDAKSTQATPLSLFDQDIVASSTMLVARGTGERFGGAVGGVADGHGFICIPIWGVYP